MAQPILFDFGPSADTSARDPYDFFEIGFTRKRQQRVRRFQLGDGYEQVTPDGVNNLINSYDLRTRPLTDAEAEALDEDFEDLNGDFFYARFPQDAIRYRYRLEPNQWSWEVITSDTLTAQRKNIITFSVKQIYDWRS